MAKPSVWSEGGKWRARVYLGVSPLTGRPRRPKTTLRATDEQGALKEADEWARGLTGESLHGMLMAFALDVQAQGAPRTHEPKANTAHAYMGMARRLAEDMPDKPAGEVTALDVTRVSQRLLSRGLSRSTVNSYCQFLSSAFGWAMEMGICEQNPARAASHPTQPAPDASGKSYTLGQARALAVALAAIDDDAEAAPEMREGAFVALMMLETGMRVGEALAVRCDDVRMAVPDIRVCGTVVSRGGLRRQETTKRGSGRTVAISQALAGRVSRHAAGKRGHEAVAGASGLLRPSWVSKALKSACTSAGVPYKPPHSLRATHATLLLSSGKGDMKAVSARLGHSTVSTTLEYYQSVLPGADRALADAFGGIVGEEG